MKIEDMIRAFPEDKIGIQALGPAITNASQKKAGTSITFLTDATNTTEVFHNTGRIGVIVWFDRNEFERLRSNPEGK